MTGLNWNDNFKIISWHSGDIESFLQSTEMYIKKQSSKNWAYLAYLVLGKFQLGDWVGTQVEDFVGFQLWDNKENKH